MVEPDVQPAGPLHLRPYARSAGDVPAPRAPVPDEEPSVVPPPDPGADPEGEPEDPGPPPLPPHPRTDPAPPADAHPAPAPAADLDAALVRARTALGFSEGPRLLEHRVEVVVELDRARTLRTVTVATRWRARDRAEAFEVVAVAPPGVRARAVVEAVRGCTAGVSYVDLRDGLTATRLELAAPVAAEGTVETVHRVGWQPTSGRLPVATSYEQRLPASFGTACVEVRFAQRRVPVRGVGFVRPADPSPGQDEEVVPLAVEQGPHGPVLRHRCGAHVTLDAPLDGWGRAGTVVVGVRWTW